MSQKAAAGWQMRTHVSTRNPWPIDPTQAARGEQMSSKVRAVVSAVVLLERT
jgi:hypothetical protein